MKHKYRNFIIITVVFVLTINVIPNVLGKTRQYYLIDFILATEVEDFGFSNVIDGEDGQDLVSFEATAYALSILNDLGRNLESFSTIESHLQDKIDEMFDNDQANIYDLYYLLKSLDLLDYNIDSSLSNKIYKYLNGTAQPSGGFSFSNTTSLPSLASTFYVIQLFSLIERPIADILNHKNWVLSCNNTDGGYGGNQTLPSTYIDTCFAVFILDDENFGDVNDLVDKDKTLDYLNSFYVNISVDLSNYGGFLPDLLAGNALLSSTYYCVRAISLIDESILNEQEIVRWVLKRQNFEDGGFLENTEGIQPKISSVIPSYYAFNILAILNSLYTLDNEVWMVEFNYVILGVVLGSIGLIIAIAVFLWRRRRI